LKKDIEYPGNKRV